MTRDRILSCLSRLSNSFQSNRQGFPSPMSNDMNRRWCWGYSRQRAARRQTVLIVMNAPLFLVYLPKASSRSLSTPFLTVVELDDKVMRNAHVVWCRFVSHNAEHAS